MNDSLTINTPWVPMPRILSKNAGTPFFCVAGRGDTERRLRHLARQMEPAIPFIPLPCLQCESELSDSSRVEKIAAGFLEDIFIIQPRGPYYIGGFCFGALIAFEMVHQILSAGKEVGLLALIEPTVTLFRKVQHPGRLQRYLFHAKLLWHLPLEESMSHLQHSLTNVARRMRGRLDVDQKKRDLHYNQMLDRYPLVPVPRSVLFLAQDSFFGSDANRDIRARTWGKLSKETAETFYFPGSHKTILREPYVEALASRLKSCMKGAAAEVAL